MSITCPICQAGIEASEPNPQAGTEMVCPECLSEFTVDGDGVSSSEPAAEETAGETASFEMNDTGDAAQSEPDGEEVDLSVIGIYQGGDQGLDHGADSVWPEAKTDRDDAPPPVPQSDDEASDFIAEIADEMMVDEDSEDEMDLEAFLQDDGAEEEIPSSDPDPFDNLASQYEKESADEVFYVDESATSIDADDDIDLMNTMGLGSEGVDSERESAVFELDTGEGTGPVVTPKSYTSSAADFDGDAATRILKRGLPKSRSRVPAVLLGILIGLILGAGGGYLALMQDLLPIKRAKDQTVVKVQETPEQAMNRARGDITAQLDRDTPMSYEAALSKLEIPFKKFGQDSAVRDEMLSTLIRFKERFPSEFAANSSRNSSWAQLTKNPKLPASFKYLNETVEAIASGDGAVAAKKFEQFLAARGNRSQSSYLLGKIRLLNGDINGAKQVFEDIRKRNPKDRRATFYLGLILSREKNYTKAEKLFKSLTGVPAAGDGKKTASKDDHLGARLELVRILHARGKSHDVLREVPSLLAQATQSREIEVKRETRLLEAAAYKQIGKAEDQEKALVALREANKIRPSEQTILGLADVYRSRNDWKEVEVLMQQCSKIKCDSLAFYTAKTNLLAQRKDVSAAMDVLKLAREKFPNAHNLNLLLGDIYRNSNQDEDALKVYLEVVKNHPQLSEPYEKVAQLYLANKTEALEARKAENILITGIQSADNAAPLRWLLATKVYGAKPLKRLEQLQQLLISNPDDVRFLSETAKTLTTLSRYEKSKEMLQALYETNRMDDELMNVFISTLMRLGTKENLEKAWILASGYLERHPKDLDSMIRVAEIDFLQGDQNDRAMAMLNRIREIQRNHAKTNFITSNLHDRLGNLDKAIAHMETALEREATNTTYRSSLVDLLKKSAKIPGSDVRELNESMKNHLDRLIKAAIENEAFPAKLKESFFRRRGDLYYNTTRYRLAVRDFETALSLNKESSVNLVNLGKTLYKLSRRKKAVSFLRKAAIADSKNATAFWFLANYAKFKRRARDYERYLKKVVATGSIEYPEAYRNLGHISRKRRKDKDAQRYYKKYLDTYKKLTGKAPSDLIEIQQYQR